MGFVLHGGDQELRAQPCLSSCRAPILLPGVNALTTAEVRETGPSPVKVDTLPCGVPLDVFGYCGA